MTFTTQRKRLIYTLAVWCAVLAAGIGYGLFCVKTGMGIPCVLHEVTGLECPGCGMEMRPQIFLRPDLSDETGAVIPGRFHWAADYCCDASQGGCGCWSTNVVRSKSPVAAMDAAWKRAMRRFEK